MLMKMLQVSMDGPNVNWKLFDILNTGLHKKYQFPLLETGSCALHALHEEFQSSHNAIGCNIQKQCSRGIFRKRCSENMQQIYRRKSMPKCDFNKVALQLY